MLTLQFDSYDPVQILSNAGVSTSLSKTPPAEILLTDFLGGVSRVEVSDTKISVDGDGWVASGSAKGEMAPPPLNEFRPVSGVTV